MSSEWQFFLDEINSTISTWEKDGCDFPVFRGHADETWDLEPSLMRLQRDFEKEEYERLEGVLYFDFVTYSAKYSRLTSSWEVLFEMRHHGLPTRLLDWSENFAMALYFAMSEGAISPTIWMLNPYRLNEITTGDSSLLNPIKGLGYNYEDGFLNDSMAKTEIDDITGVLEGNTGKPPFNKPIAIVPPLSSDRLFAQKGLFTLQGKGSDVPINKVSEFQDCYKKIVLPNGARDDANAFIKLSGVNEFTAYPDLDGLSRFLQTKYEVSDTAIKQRRSSKAVTRDSDSTISQNSID
jgi:hypothetical protein